MGENCRYNGETKSLDKAVDLFESGQVVCVCPEVLGGMDTPREPSEISPTEPGKVYSKSGVDVTKEFYDGASKSLEIGLAHQVKYAVLKGNSPSCGKGTIYSGRFDGTLTEGDGVTAKLLSEKGIKVYTELNAPYEKLKVYDYLDSLEIVYSRVEHEPVYTVEEAKDIVEDLDGAHCKNLFLRNRKGSEHYLVILPEDQPFNLKEFQTKYYKTNISFASEERLMKYLGIRPGSVSVFGLLNDRDRKVQVFVSDEFNKEGKITFHPNVNDETLTLDYKDFIRFIESFDYDINYC